MKHLSLAMFAVFLSAGAAISADAPKAALDACLKHADAYSGVPAGTAQFAGNAESDVPWFGGGAGSAWRLQINVSGGTNVTCTVSEDGKKVALEPTAG